MRRALALPLALALLACGAPSDATTSATTDDPGTTAADPGTTTTDDPTGEPTSTGDDPGTTTAGPTTGAATTASGSTTDPGTDTGGGSAESTTADDTGAIAEELPPIESVEILEAWLADGAYKAWAVESKVHPSTGPHGGNVRTYVNQVALASLMAANSEHPQDAATVKELYGAGTDTIIGYAVSRKTQPTSEGGATWYWYERVNDTTYGGDLGVGLCTGCHGGGADYILTPFPLQ